MTIHPRILNYSGLLLVLAIAATALGQATPEKLRLSDSQIAALKQIKTDSEKKAGPIALELAATAKQVYENLLSDKEASDCGEG